MEEIEVWARSMAPRGCTRLAKSAGQMESELLLEDVLVGESWICS